MNKSIEIFPTPQALAESLAMELANQIRNAETSSSAFTIAISGGSTPRLLFSTLGDKYANPADWSNVHFFWVDERCVPPDDPESNFGMIRTVFLNKIGIKEENIHRMRGEEDPGKEAKRYSKEINEIVPVRNGFPCLNLMLLGLGDDGHTASIFPGNEKLFSSEKVCDTAVHPITGQKRITLTGGVINNSEKIIFLVTGKNKARIVENILGNGDNKKQFPASYIKPVHGKIIWFLDEESGSLLKTGRGNHEI